MKSLSLVSKFSLTHFNCELTCRVPLIFWTAIGRGGYLWRRGKLKLKSSLLSRGWVEPGSQEFGLSEKIYTISGQIIATSHEFSPPNGGLVREISGKPRLVKYYNLARPCVYGEKKNNMKHKQQPGNSLWHFLGCCVHFSSLSKVTVYNWPPNVFLGEFFKGRLDHLNHPETSCFHPPSCGWNSGWGEFPGVLTFLYFPLLVGLAFLADKGAGMDGFFPWDWSLTVRPGEEKSRGFFPSARRKLIWLAWKIPHHFFYMGDTHVRFYCHVSFLGCKGTPPLEVRLLTRPQWKDNGGVNNRSIIRPSSFRGGWGWHWGVEPLRFP